MERGGGTASPSTDALQTLATGQLNWGPVWGCELVPETASVVMPR